MNPPQLLITIKRIGAAERHEYEAVLTRADNNAEICTNTFTFNPGLLIDIEPQWMLNKAVPRRIDDTARGDKTAAEFAAEQAQKLAEYGQRLYGFLFGDGKELQSFLKYNDAYAKSAHLTLALHSSAAILWRLPWEYIHDGQDFLALHGKFQLSRRPHELGKLEREPVHLPLRLLIIISSPEDAVELNTEKEISAIQEALDDAERGGLIRTEYLEDATLEAIGEALKNFNPHVIHYTGHGIFKEDKQKPENSRSYLALEQDDGRTKLAGIKDLRPHLQQATELRLAVLSGCQTAQTSDSDAFSGVATGMLAVDIPAVVAMQFSILDSSGIQLARAFYTALAQGESLAAAMGKTRVSLWQFAEGPGYDWGIPALYLRTQAMVLVDANQKDLAGLEDLRGLTPSTLINIGGLPLPRHFVGRKRELRQLRKALADNRTKSAFIRGIGGMGKSSLAAKLAQRPGTPLDGILVIRCHEVDALDIPGKIASYLQSQGIPGHAEAGNLLLDSRLDPAERAQRAAQLVANRRYLFVFDNFESVQAVPGTGESSVPDKAVPPVPGTTAYPVADENLSGLLRGLLTANWRSLCLFTGRFRWRGYADVVRQEIGLAIHLPELTAPQTMMLMNNLSRLRQEKRAVKIAMYHKVGGHPKTIELLNGWLKDGSVGDLLTDKRLDGLLTAEWEEYFLKRLLGKLNEAERAALTRLSIFQTKLDEAELDYAGVDEALVRRWLDLSLMQREVGAVREPPLPPHLAELLPMLPPAEQAKLKAQTQPRDRYTVHPVVAEYLLAQTTAEERHVLHRWAADFYGQPFVGIARNYATQTGQNWTDEEIEQRARHDQGVVGLMVARTDNMVQARSAMARALNWQRHLFAANEVMAANEIVIATCGTLARWGEHDRAKELLRRCIASLKGNDSSQIVTKAVVSQNLATILQQEGKLSEALAMYERGFEIFASVNARQQMAASLSSIASINMAQGNIDKAIENEERSMALSMELGDVQGQAMSLNQLAIMYHMKGAYEASLAHSQKSGYLARKIKDETLTVSSLHMQGQIYVAMANSADSDEDRQAYREKAKSHFRESLTTLRYVDNEPGIASSLGELGKLLLDDGEINEAIAAFNEALEIDRRLGRPTEVAIDLEFLGMVHERQGEYKAALAKFQEALALFRRYAPHDMTFTENNIARVQAKLRGR